MLIETLIRLRTDGTVKADVGDVKYVFKPMDDGRVVCEVEDENHIAYLLANGNFFPAELDEDVEQGDWQGVPSPLEGVSLADILNNLDKSGLLEYAKQNSVKVDGRMSVETLRKTIAESMIHGNA